MLQHIALEIKEKDLQDFYVGILGGKVESHSTLKEKDAINIFQVNEQVPVYSLQIQNVKFELFVHESIERDSLQHLCINLKNASEIFQKANQKNYTTFIKKSENGETYFIRDDNRNIFEVKNGEEYYEDYLG